MGIQTDFHQRSKVCKSSTGEILCGWFKTGNWCMHATMYVRSGSIHFWSSNAILTVASVLCTKQSSDCTVLAAVEVKCKPSSWRVGTVERLGFDWLCRICFHASIWWSALISYSGAQICQQIVDFLFTYLLTYLPELPASACPLSTLT